MVTQVLKPKAAQKVIIDENRKEIEAHFSIYFSMFIFFLSVLSSWAFCHDLGSNCKTSHRSTFSCQSLHTSFWLVLLALHAVVSHCTPHSDWCSLLYMQLSVIAHLILIGVPCSTFSCQSLHTSFWLVFLAPHSAVNHCTPHSDWCSLLHIQLSIIAHLILIGAPCSTFSCQSLHTSFWLVLLAPHLAVNHCTQHPICSWCLPWRNLGSTHA